MRSHRAAFVVSLVLALLVAALWSAAPASADGPLVLTFPEEVGMETFLQAVAEKTGMTLVWNPADKNVRGKTLIGGIRLEGDRQQIFDGARALLTFYELVFVPVGPGGRVTLVVDARQATSILKLKPEVVTLTDANLGEYEDADGRFVTTTIAVEHLRDLRSARNALTRIVTGQNIGNVTEVPGANAIVVTDFAPNVVALYRLLRQMDVSSAASSTTGGRVEAIALRHALAADVANVLGRHFGVGAASGPGKPNPDPSTSEPSAPRITPDARTNRVLVTGTDAEIEKVREAIQLVDVPVEGQQQHAFQIRLVHVAASQVARALELLLVGNELWRGAGPHASRPNIVALQSESQNLLLVSATREAHAEIQRFVAAMDVPGSGNK